MADYQAVPTGSSTQEVVTRQPPVNAALLIYALFAIAALVGVASHGFPLFAPLLGIVGIVAIIIAYVKRDEATGTWVASHFRWLIRTFWWSLLWARNPEAFGSGVLYMFSTGVYTSILGALLTFSRTLWYPAYAETVQAWGLSAIEDQQTGGLIMWVPGGIVYLVAGLFLFSEWLRHTGVTAGRRYAD